tara:strand:+ start:169 stop:831 length:663 start_codon:yes stop_codon:yes gene_type:complete
MNAGIIVAAGKGERYGSYKQTEILINKKVYQYSLDVFNIVDLIESVYLVVAEEIYSSIEEDLQSYQNNKPIFLCRGGDTRAQSVYNAIKSISNVYDKVCIHDAVRPLIQKADIENVLLNCIENGGCIVGDKIHETLKKTNNDKVVETINRANMWLSQTPQAFCLKTLKNCYDKDFKHFTDEANLLESNGYNIQVINSVNKNIKITEKKDLELVKQLLSNE